MTPGYIQRLVPAVSMRKGRVAYLPVTTLIGASERRKGEVTYKVDCRVQIQRPVPALSMRKGRVAYLPVTTLTGASERRKGRVM